MPARMFTGVFTALTTPLTADGGALDLDALAPLLERQVAAGVAGVVPCGTTGEFSTLSDEERRTLVERCVQLADGGIDVVPQTGALSTATAVAHTRHAAALGCPGVLVMPPFFGTASEGELLRHFDAVVRAAEIAIIYYHNPWATGLSLSPTQIVAICRAVGIEHIKYTSSDMSGFVALQRAPGIAQVLPAWDDLIFPSRLAGAQGTIWGAAAAVPELCVRLWRLAEDDPRAFVQAWSQAQPLFSELGALGYTPAVKAVSALLGTPVGPPRAPLLGLAPDGIDRLSGALRGAGYGLPA